MLDIVSGNLNKAPNIIKWKYCDIYKEMCVALHANSISYTKIKPKRTNQTPKHQPHLLVSRAPSLRWEIRELSR